MSDSFTEPASVSQDIIRSLFSTLDRPAYWLLGLVYELFFNVASADLFSNNTIMKFYGRVQVILGVFMMFQLAMTILKGIVTPDTFISKDKGMGNLITRVATSLILITVLMPISIPAPKNEYEIQINNNGLLFGTLYSLQHRILENNTLGRLVLGTNGDNEFVAAASNEDTELKKSARIFTSTILKGFYRINLVPEDQRDTTYISAGKDPAAYNVNRVCKDIDDEILAAYTRIDADPGDIISLVNATCDSDVQPGFINNLKTNIQKLTGSTKYVFAYMPVVSTVVAVVFVFILLSFTVDVSVRAVKLAVLRLIAPIPIIAYMDPKGGKDSAFSSWVKTLSSTYLDIFIRLAVVYFVIFLIQDMIINGIVIDVGTGVLGVVSHIVIWIGLFIFAKQAPKFIKQVLGMKDDGGKLFGGFAEIGAAMGIGAGVLGSVGSGLASARASRMADETRKSLGENVDPNSVLNRGKHILAGITGGIAGGATGVHAAMTAKDHAFKNSLEAMQKRNSGVLAKGNDGSTFLGRMGSSISQFATGDGAAAAGARRISTLESQQKALDAIKKRVSGEMVKKDWTRGSLGIDTDMHGNKIGDVNYKSFMAEYTAAQSRGDKTLKFKDFSGTSFEIDLADAERQKGFLLKNNEDSYIQQITSGTAKENDVELLSLIADATAKGANSAIKDKNDRVVYTQTVDGKITSRKDITEASEALGQIIRDESRTNMVNQANDRYSGGKK